MRTASESGRYAANASSPSTGSLSTACTKSLGTRASSTWLPLCPSLTSWRLATSSKSAWSAKPKPTAVTGKYAKTSSPLAERCGASASLTGKASEMVVVLSGGAEDDDATAPVGRNCRIVYRCRR